jgi:hypothetical protein
MSNFMRVRTSVLTLGLAFLLAGNATSLADVAVRDFYHTANGWIQISPNNGANQQNGLQIVDGENSADSQIFLEVVPKSNLMMVVDDGDYAALAPGDMHVTGEMRIVTTDGRTIDLSNARIERDLNDPTKLLVFDVNEVATLELVNAHHAFHPETQCWSMEADARLTAELTRQLGVDADATLASVSLYSQMELAQSVGIDGSGIQYGNMGPDGFTTGPDVIVGDLPQTGQYGRVGAVGSGTVGLSTGTTSCNKGDVPLHWFALPNTDHPVIGFNLYRLKTENGVKKFRDLGQSWLKHGFTALQQDACNFGCTPSGSGAYLGVGCSDPYSASLNSSQCSLGPRGLVNPYTGYYPGGNSQGSGGGCSSPSYPSRYHIGHNHNGISHRLQVQDVDLMGDNQTMSTFYVEGQYVTPHEYDAADGNQFNNVSYRQVNVSGPSGSGTFSFNNVGSTQREKPAIYAWTTSTKVMVEPAPGEDGRFYLAYEVTDLGNGTWHYEYMIYNMNLDRAVGAFSVPIPDGVNVSNAGFAAPLNHAPEAGAPTFTNETWTPVLANKEITWACTPYDVNDGANAVRWGTGYSFWFDADCAPAPLGAEVKALMFKTGETVTLAGAAPSQECAVILGDMNCDGALNTLDIEPFTLALTDPAAYENDYPGCDINNGDMNDDGDVNTLDIEPFVDALTP